MPDTGNAICPDCKLPVPETVYFCPNCGKQLRKKPPGTGISKQITVYAVSFFLAPLGLIYVWRYIRQPDRKSKNIGIAALVLTAMAVGLSVWAGNMMIQYINQSLSSLQGLGI